jgi:hypothetical protein
MRAFSPCRLRRLSSVEGRGENKIVIDIFQRGVITAFGAGTISCLSPCALPLVPGYVSQWFPLVATVG